MRRGYDRLTTVVVCVALVRGLANEAAKTVPRGFRESAVPPKARN